MSGRMAEGKASGGSRMNGIVDANVVADDTPRYMESPMPILDAPNDSQQGRLWVYIERLR
jgi:hypothetical protein